MLQTLSYCPTLQKGSKAIAANYKPVSLTSHIVKIYERILRKKMLDHLERKKMLDHLERKKMLDHLERKKMLDHLERKKMLDHLDRKKMLDHLERKKMLDHLDRKKMLDHLERNNLLCKNQHGLRKGKSCPTQLLHHLDDVIDSFCQAMMLMQSTSTMQKPVTQWMMDHRLLLMKPNHYGLSDKMVEWIKYFLSNRYQKVVIDGRASFLHSYSVAFLRVQFLALYYSSSSSMT